MVGMRKPQIRKALILVSFILGISCSLFAPSPTPIIEPRHPWITKWLQNPACQPPCWENITPGVTSMYEAYLLLPQIPGVDVSFPPVGNPYDNSKQMQWQLDGSSDTGIAESDSQGEIIIELILRVGAFQNLALEEVTSYYGPPSEGALSNCREELFRKSCFVDLIYSDLRMVLSVFLIDHGNEKNHQVEILPDTKIERVMLFPLEHDYYLKLYWPDGKEDELFFQWEGYKEYP